VCHTDLHAADGDWPVKPSPPFIPGHEGVGTVVALGAGVTAVKEGDRVGVPWLHTACGHCRHCLGGWETLCDGQQNTGYSVNGGFAEYTLADPNYVGHLPDSLDWNAAAPILCAGFPVYKGLKETDTKPGDTVVISGIGGLGHVAVQYAKAMGRNVIAVDISDEKMALARAMGADAAINAKTTGPGRRGQETLRRRARRARDRRVASSLQPGIGHARQARHDGSRWLAAGLVRT
jgi:alcohol dehydrogenase, propanol-preferring